MTPSALINQWHYFAIRIADVTMRTDVGTPRTSEQALTIDDKTWNF